MISSMGPEVNPTITPASTDVSMALAAHKLTQLLKLARDGSNWPTYQEKILNTIRALKLCHNLAGTALKPAELIQKGKKFYKPGVKTPLTADDPMMYED